MIDPAESAFGGHLNANGATLEPEYHQGKQGIVGVPIMDIRDATDSALEERVQAVVGTFFASGSFWLGVDKLVSDELTGTVFIVCGSAFAFGVVLAWAGFRQSARRVSRLERYCPKEAKH